MPAQTSLPRPSVADQLFAAIAKSGHLLGALVVACIVGVIILPLNPAALDALIVTNIAVSVLLVTLATYITSILGLSTFPSLIVISTLFRLALNIASTKQILLNANAGHVIETFGKLVMGGSIIVGLVAFSIIAIVQFLVVSKGAERVAEVAARFTLDSLPGRQMSIEADLRAANIDKEEARRLRDALHQESHMYGSMDGAMKFVKGDAIACMLIAVINLVGGIGVGMLLKNMSFAQAADRYTLLSIGDGMAAQIPSLLTSVAAAILITRAIDPPAQASNLSRQVGRQVAAQPMALVAAGGVVSALAFVPGFPSMLFVLVAMALAGTGALILKRERKGTPPAPGGLLPVLGADTDARADASAIEQNMIVVPLLLRVSGNLLERLSPAAMQEQMQRQRVQVHHDLGVPFPAFQVRIDPSLAGYNYVIDVQEVPMVQAQLEASLVEQVSTGGAEGAEGELAHAVGSVVRYRADAFVGMQEVQSVVKRAQSQLPDLSEEVLRAFPLQRLADVLRRLALEGVSLRYLREIYESLLIWHSREKDLASLCEYVRVDLGRFITHAFIDQRRRLLAITVSTQLEAQIRGAIQTSANGSYIALAPEVQNKLFAAVEAAAKQVPATLAPVLVTTIETRRFMRRLLALRFPRLTLLSYQELPADVQLVSLATLAIDAGARAAITPAS
jgi:type III secretion protein V